ncbi:MAG: AAA family ATPase, partial [Bacilli bacterium]|nr:AAA family ATPase [Bacilli bacterium]
KFTIQKGAEKVVHDCLGYGAKEFAKKAGKVIQRIHEIFTHPATGDVYSFIASYEPSADFQENYNCNKVYVQFIKDLDKFDQSFQATFCSPDRDRFANTFDLYSDEGLKKAYSEATYPLVGFSDFNVGTENTIAFNIGKKYIEEQVERQLINEILLETSQTYLDKENVVINSIYYEGDHHLNDMTVIEVYYSIGKKDYVFNVETKDCAEAEPFEPYDEGFDECPAVKYLVKKANAKYNDGYVERQVDARFNKEVYSKQFREAFNKHFPSVTLTNDFKPEFPGFAEEETIFIVNDDSISIRISSDNEELETIPFITITDRFETVMGKIDSFTKQQSKFTKAWLNEVNLQLKEKSLRAFSKVAQSLIEGYSAMPTSQKNLPEVALAHSKIRNKVSEYNKLDLSKLNKITGRIRDYVDNRQEKTAQDNNALREKIYDLRSELNEQEAYETTPEWNEFTERLLKEDFKDESISNIRRVFIHKNAKKEYADLSPEAKNAVIEIVRNMKTLNGLALLKYFVSSLQMNAPFFHINYKVRMKNIPAHRIWFWYGKDFTDREGCAGDIYIRKFTTNKHDEDIERSKNDKPYKYQENDFEIFAPEHKDRNFYLPELTTEQYKISSKSEGPSVTYGCAGSGKTLDSIDQYWLIHKTLEERNDEDKDSIAYITFQSALKDKAIEQIKAYEITPHCYTLPDYFKYVAKSKVEKGLSDEKTFVKWFEDYYIAKNGKGGKRTSDIKYIKDMPDTARLVFTYYRGMYKGSKALFDYAWSTGKGRHVLTEDEFKSQLSHEANNDSTGVHYLTKDQIQNIYDVCHTYYEVYCKGNKYDDNDWAIDALVALKGKSGRRTRTIIIDEVQDLTSLQLRVLLRSLKANSTNIFFYGDPHQTINPTVFDDGVLSTAVRDVLNCELKDGVQLTDMHRTNVGLRKYLAGLQEKRTEWLGSYMDDVAKVNDNSDDADDKEKRWATKLFDKKLEYTILKQAQDSAAMIIVPDETTKDYLEEKYPTLRKNYMFTIYEAKGIEWRRVVLYNMLSNAKYYFSEMIKGEGKRSTICRTFFNKFYVACTRARDTFIVIEDDLPEDVREEILSPLPEITDLEQVKYYFDGNATYTEWIEEARKLMASGTVESALYALSQASTLASSDDEVNYVLALSNTLTRKSLSVEDNLRNGDGAYRKGQYVIAQLHYKAAKNYDKYNLCLIRNGQQIEKAEYLLSLINSGLLNGDLEAYKRLGEQKVFYELLDGTYKRLTSKKGKK